MKNIWLIHMNSYRSGDTFEVCDTKETAIKWILREFSFRPKQMKHLNDHDFLEYGEEEAPSKISLIFCPIIKE